MNLSPAWVNFLAEAGIEATHWSSVGDPRASDEELMSFARSGHWVVFTHDLDFTTILAVTNAESPSVVQVRAHNILPSDIGTQVVRALRENLPLLEQGALVTIDFVSSRVRTLPLRYREGT